MMRRFPDDAALEISRIVDWLDERAGQISITLTADHLMFEIFIGMFIIEFKWERMKLPEGSEAALLFVIKKVVLGINQGDIIATIKEHAK